jgi:hypothetical protein
MVLTPPVDCTGVATHEHVGGEQMVSNAETQPLWLSYKQGQDLTEGRS